MIYDKKLFTKFQLIYKYLFQLLSKTRCTMHYDHFIFLRLYFKEDLPRLAVLLLFYAHLQHVLRAPLTTLKPVLYHKQE